MSIHYVLKASLPRYWRHINTFRLRLGLVQPGLLRAAAEFRLPLQGSTTREPQPNPNGMLDSLIRPHDSTIDSTDRSHSLPLILSSFPNGTSQRVVMAPLQLKRTSRFPTVLFLPECLAA